MKTEILKSSILAEYSKRSFYNFFKYFWSSVETAEFEDNWHIKTVCDTLQERFELYVDDKVSEKKLYDLIFNLPPGSSKSLICSVFFPAWVWLIRPKTKIISYSYSYKIAEELASKSFRLLSDDTYKSITNWKLTGTAISFLKNDKMGFRFVTSTGGAITGIHADIIIGDDPNSPASINSEAYRLEARRFVREILPSRKTSIKRSYSITVQQRLHNDDVTGCLSDLTNTKIIAIPAINEKGESFYPSRFPLESINSKREELGTISFMSQYQQVTQSVDGQIIKRDWLKFSNTVQKPLTYFIDSAYGGKNADDNAIIGCYKEGNYLVIQKCEINKFEFPQLIKWLTENIEPNSKIYIEGKASGKSIIQTLKLNTDFNIIETNPRSSKLERKTAVSPYFESGRIIINEFISFKNQLVEQVIFDNTKHDDIMDVICMAIEQLLKVNGGTYHIM